MKNGYFVLEYIVIHYPTGYRYIEERELEAKDEDAAIEEAMKVYLDMFRDAELSNAQSSGRSVPKEPCVAHVPAGKDPSWKDKHIRLTVKIVVALEAAIEPMRFYQFSPE